MGAWEDDAIFAEGHEPIDTPDDVWTDREYNDTDIADLTTTHIQNIIKGLKRGQDYFGQGHKLPNLEAELNKRLKESN